MKETSFIEKFVDAVFLKNPGPKMHDSVLFIVLFDVPFALILLKRCCP